MINQDNFFQKTFASFTACETPQEHPHYISLDKKGKVSSCYWYGTDDKGDYVIRNSHQLIVVFPQQNEFNKEVVFIRACWLDLSSESEFSDSGKCYFSAFLTI